ncbi:MAG: ABC transporter permease [Chloroflexi bacterium]|nr:ABC transporter permease [Chloroflexota bacterium]
MSDAFVADADVPAGSSCERVSRPPRGLRALGRRVGRNRLAALGGTFALVVVLLGVTASWVAPYDPIEQNTARRLEDPSGDHLLGTDQFGRDILSRILFGSRTTLLVSTMAVGIAVVVGGTLGLLAGYLGGRVERGVTMLVDVLLSFPLILLAIMVVVILGPGVVNLAIAIGVAQVPIFARLGRALTLAAREREFVVAARGLGATSGRIMARHLLPNIAAPLGIQATTTLALAVLSATSLSFLGLGVQPPTPDWGAMINDSKRFIFDRPELSLYPGAAIALTVLSLNLLGDGLMDELDPMARAQGT